MSFWGGSVLFLQPKPLTGRSNITLFALALSVEAITFD
jgi:hypothetical protein